LLGAAIASACGHGDEPASAPPVPAPPPPPVFATPGEPLRPRPAPPAVPAPKDPAIGLAGSGDATCAVRASGAVTCWGGVFGAPHAVALGGDVVQLVLDYGEACMRHRDGRVDCIEFEDGKLDESHLRFQHIDGIAFATDLAVAGEGWCVLEKSGDVACWVGDHTATRTRLHHVTAMTTGTLLGPDWQFPGVGFACAVVAGDLACVDVYRQAEQSRTDPRTPIDRYLAPPGTKPKLYLGAPKVVLAKAEQPFVPDAANEGTVCARVAGAVTCVQLDLSLTASPAELAEQSCTTTASSATCTFDIVDARQPVALDHPVEVRSSGEHACARYGAGQVACWGAYDHGALGRAVPAPVTPTQVWGLDDAIDLASWSDGVVALRANGQLAYWGRGEVGERHDVVRSDVPLTVSTIRDATKLVAGHFHACVLRRTGAVACWGITPVFGLEIATSFADLPGLHDVRELYATDFGLLVRTGDGTLLHVGDPQLDASAAPTAPAPIRGAEHAHAIAIAGHWVCVLDRSPGQVRCWAETRKGATTAPIIVADDVVELAGTGAEFAGASMAAKLVVRQRDGHALAIALDVADGKPVATPAPLAAGARSLLVSRETACARGADGTSCISAERSAPPAIARAYDDALALTAAPPLCAIAPSHHVVCFASTDEWTDGTGRGASRVPVPVPLD